MSPAAKEDDPQNPELDMETAQLENSFLGRLGRFIQPIFAPLGFDWRTSVAVLTGFVAKEIVVSTLGVLYAAGADVNEESEALRRSLRASGMTPLGAYALMAFVLIYIPCLATVAVIRRETNSWKWTGFSVGYSLALAWVVSFLIYQGGMILGLA
jgi:ferrous iron transport protein B